MMAFRSLGQSVAEWLARWQVQQALAYERAHPGLEAERRIVAAYDHLVAVEARAR